VTDNYDVGGSNPFIPTRLNPNRKKETGKNGKLYDVAQLVEYLSSKQGARFESDIVHKLRCRAVG
jgi:hypothetical protein